MFYAAILIMVLLAVVLAYAGYREGMRRGKTVSRSYMIHVIQMALRSKTGIQVSESWAYRLIKDTAKSSYADGVKLDV